MKKKDSDKFYETPRVLIKVINAYLDRLPKNKRKELLFEIQHNDVIYKLFMRSSEGATIEFAQTKIIVRKRQKSDNNLVDRILREEMFEPIEETKHYITYVPYDGPHI